MGAMIRSRRAGCAIAASAVVLLLLLSIFYPAPRDPGIERYGADPLAHATAVDAYQTAGWYVSW